MVDYHYDDNTHRRAARRRQVKVAFITLVALGLMVAIIIIIDSLRTQTQVTQVDANSQRTLGQSAQQQVFDEKWFILETDPTWERVDPKPEFDKYTTVTYRSSDHGLSLRELTVFIDTIPSDYALTYVLPVEIEQGRIEPFSISPRCNELLPPKAKKHLTIKLSWAGVDFFCDPDRGTYLVGTSHNKQGYGLELAGPTTAHRYFFLYNDVESTPQLDNFAAILRTFEPK